MIYGLKYKFIPKMRLFGSGSDPYPGRNVKVFITLAAYPRHILFSDLLYYYIIQAFFAERKE